MVAPMLAEEALVRSLTPYLTNDDWVIEQKLDGHRLLLIITDGSMVAITRNGTPYTRKLPAALTDFKWPSGSWVIDGELVDGTLWVFDMPRCPLYADEPLHIRRTAVTGLVANLGNPALRLVPQARTTDEKVDLAGQALTEGFEGLVIKRRDSAYRYDSRSSQWLKVKFVSTADVVVTDVRGDGKESVGYAVYDGDDLVNIGRASLLGKEKVDTIAVGDVIEVRYLYCTPAPRLYQPTIVRKRNDKEPHECTTSQLRFVNKTVLQAL